jgi:hypothetical protein
MSLRPKYLPGAKIIFNKWPNTVVRLPELRTTNDVVTCQENGQWNIARPFKLKRGMSLLMRNPLN